MLHRFQSTAVPPSSLGTPALWFAYQDNRLLLHADGERHRIPCVPQLSDLGAEPILSLSLGALGKRHCYAVELNPEYVPASGMVFRDLRSSLALLNETLSALAGRAFQIIHWNRTHQFCGQCGSRTRSSSGEHARKCDDCGLLAFPRLSPAIIVLIQRGRELLLARSPLLPSGMYSMIAGFVEPGETLEEAVAREVMEEVGITVRNIRYFGSQPWPFPHSLMIGFNAEYASGELTVARQELEDAGWYLPDALPILPPKISIARRLIDHALGETPS